MQAKVAVRSKGDEGAEPASRQEVEQELEGRELAKAKVPGSAGREGRPHTKAERREPLGKGSRTANLDEVEIHAEGANKTGASSKPRASEEVRRALATSMAVEGGVKTLLPRVCPHGSRDGLANVGDADGALSQGGVGTVGIRRERHSNVGDNDRAERAQQSKLLGSFARKGDQVRALGVLSIAV